MSTLENKYQSVQFKIIDKRTERSPDGYTYYTFSPICRENLVLEVKMKNSFECIKNDRHALRTKMIECYDSAMKAELCVEIMVGDVI